MLLEWLITRLWNRFQETRLVQHLSGQDRSRATTVNNDRYTLLTVRRNGTVSEIQLLLATGRRISSHTIRNRFHEGGLYARRPVVCVPMTSRQRQDRREWNIEVGGNVIGIKCRLRTSPDSV
ncbi:transposable element Tcb2 transposase [Trichonephila clavipes]|nr:transposable element Tcb2 transposase [Trichonephila clavipes]